MTFDPSVLDSDVFYFRPSRNACLSFTSQATARARFLGDIRVLFYQTNVKRTVYVVQMQIERSRSNLLMVRLLRYAKCNANPAGSVYVHTAAKSSLHL